MEPHFMTEAESEFLMRPFTGVVMVPGYRRERYTETRLFYDLLWLLLRLGYSEEQLVDFAISKRWSTRPPLPEKIAYAKAIYILARQNNLRPSPEFSPCFEDQHPRFLADRFK